jgi:hypothetical protein
MRRVLLVGLALLFASVLEAGAPAGAKTGVWAMITSGLPTTAPPGSRIRITWRLADRQGHPFGAGGVFVRLLSAEGSTTAFAPGHAYADGRYAAIARVPARGVEAVEVGIRGTSEVLFPLRRDPYDGWSILYRPLYVPRLAAGDPCPVSSLATGVDFAAFGVRPGYGPGPAYPIGFDAGTTLRLRWTEGDATAWPWGVQKVLWFVHPRYAGPLLIRGRQLDGPNLIRFDRGLKPPAEIRIEPNRSPDGRGRPSSTRLLTPGCYAYQLDGTSFSRLVVFRAVKGV